MLQERRPAVLIDHLIRNHDLTPAEQEIARYLLAHGDEARSLSTVELAMRTHTSKATVTRLVRKLDCTSYHEFQTIFDREQVELARLKALVSEDPVGAQSTYEDIVQAVRATHEKDIVSSLMGLDRRTMARAVRRISNARKVDLYGCGVTQPIAELTAFKLSTLDIECSVSSGLNEHYVMADRHPEQKVAVLFSLTGGNPNMVYIATWLKRRNYYILGIGGDVKDDLARLCTDYITAPMGENVLGMEVVRAFNLVNSVVDVLFTALLVVDYDRNRKVALGLVEEGAGEEPGAA